MKAVFRRRAIDSAARRRSVCARWRRYGFEALGSRGCASASNLGRAARREPPEATGLGSSGQVV